MCWYYAHTWICCQPDVAPWGVCPRHRKRTRACPSLFGSFPLSAHCQQRACDARRVADKTRDSCGWWTPTCGAVSTTDAHSALSRSQRKACYANALAPYCSEIRALFVLSWPVHMLTHVSLATRCVWAFAPWCASMHWASPSPLHRHGASQARFIQLCYTRWGCRSRRSAETGACYCRALLTETHHLAHTVFCSILAAC